MKLNNRTHSAVVRLGFGMAVLLFVFPLTAAAQERVDWEVVNPFPFIKRPEAINELREVYSALTKKSALELERELQRRDEKRINTLRERDMKRCLSTGSSARECTKKHWYPYLGWFSSLAENSHSGTCWDSSRLKFRTDDLCADYFKPKDHRVRIWTKSVGVTWFVDGVKQENPAPCTDHDRQGQACFELNVTYDPNGKAPGVSVEARDSQNNLIAAVGEPIKVRNILVAGLGDSFAAGEGNPDIPAQFMEDESDRDWFYFWKWRRLPRKDKFDPEKKKRLHVRWLDTRCHRSMYSYQFKAALRYALENPKQVVTYASYACSGATTDNIFRPKGEQTPQEALPPDSDYRPLNGKIKLQLPALKEAIGDRPIDILLLSSGGNDIGFADYVAYVVTSGKTRWLIGKAPKEKRIRRELRLIRANYKNVRDAIFDTTTSVRINGCEHTPGNCRQIILTPYPNVFKEGENSVCPVLRNEFTMPFNKDLGRGKRVQSLYDNLFSKLKEFQESVPSAFGWSLANSTEKEWLDHGFCAQDETRLKTHFEERFIMPQRKNWEWRAYKPDDNEEYKLGTYEPWNYNAYASRKRWIRLPIDSKLTADQQRRLWKFSVDFLFEDDRSSVMHPTAEGHANNADANYDVMKALLH